MRKCSRKQRILAMLLCGCLVLPTFGSATIAHAEEPVSDAPAIVEVEEAIVELAEETPVGEALNVPVEELNLSDEACQAAQEEGIFSSVEVEIMTEGVESVTEDGGSVTRDDGRATEKDTKDVEGRVGAVNPLRTLGFSLGRAFRQVATQAADISQKPVGEVAGKGQVEVTSAIVATVKDGTADFDADDAPGHDSSQENGICRTFDTTTYTVGYTLDVKDENYRAFKEGKVYVEATLPASSTKAAFQLANMSWLNDAKLTESGGAQKLTGWRYVTTGGSAVAIPGAGTLSFPVKFLAMENGESLAPSFDIWYDGQGSKQTAKADPVKASCKEFLDVNIREVRSGGLNQFDIVDGSTKVGQNFNTILQVGYSNDKGNVKGSKILNKGDKVSFDLTTTGTFGEITAQKNAFAGFQNGFSDPNWEVKVNSASSITLTHTIGEDKKEVIDKLLSTTDRYNFASILQANKLHTVTERTPSVPEGKDYAVTNTVTDSNLKVNGKDASQSRTDNDRAYSTVAIYPDGSITIMTHATKLANFYSQGSSWDLNNLEAEFNGRDKAPKGAYKLIEFHARLSHSAYSMNNRLMIMAKWDADAFEPITNMEEAKKAVLDNAAVNPNGDAHVTESDAVSYAHLEKISDSNCFIFPNRVFSDKDVNAAQTWFVGKKGNWQNAEEMQKADFWTSGLTFYPTLSALKAAGDTCVGEVVRYEKRFEKAFDNTLLYGTSAIAALKVKDTAETGKVYEYHTNFIVGNVAGDAFPESPKDAAATPREQLAKNTNIGLKSNLYTSGAGSTALREDYTAYDKSIYTDGQMTGGHVAGRQWGNSLYITKAYATLARGIDNKDASGSEYRSFDAASSDTIISHWLKPELVTYDGTNPTGEIVITDEIPAEFKLATNNKGENLVYLGGEFVTTDPSTGAGEYRGGTLLKEGVDYTWEKNKEDNESPGVLKITLKNVKANSEIPTIHYGLNIDPSADTGDEVSAYTSKASLFCDLDGREALASNHNYREITVSVGSIKDLRLVKILGKSEELLSNGKFKEEDAYTYIEKDGRIVYTIILDNISATQEFENVKLVDVLPSTGDLRGSKFSGSVKVVDVEVEVLDNNRLENEKTFATTKTLDADYSPLRMLGNKDRKIEGKDGFAEIKNDTVNPNAKALAFDLGTVGPNTKVRIYVTVDTSGNAGGDIYFNDTRLSAKGLGEDVIAQPVVTTVKERKLSGTVWLDENADGKMETSEEKLSGITVTLKNQDGSDATDVSGNKIAAKKTDAKGYYEFTNLKAGTYRVVFTDPNGREYTKTLASGVANEVNSKADSKGIIASAVVKDEAKAVTHLPYQNAGLIENPTITPVKEVSIKTPSIGEEFTYTLKFAQEKNAIGRQLVITDQFKNEDGSKITSGVEIAQNTIKATFKSGSNAKDITGQAAITMDGKTGFKIETKQDLKKGESVEVTYKAKITDPKYSGKKVENETIGKFSNGPSGSAKTIVTPILPKLAIVKTNDKQKVDIGENIRYQIKITQTVKDAKAINVKLDDVFDAKGVAIDKSSIKVAFNGEDITANTVITGDETNAYKIATKKDLTDKDEIVVTYNAKVTDIALQGRKITNVATATSDNTDPVDDDAIVTPNRPGIEIDKKVNRETVGLTEIAKYTLTVTETNDNATAFSVDVDDQFELTGMEIKEDTIKVMKNDVDVTAKCKITMGENLNGFAIKTAQNIKKTDVIVVTFDTEIKDPKLQGKTLNNTATAVARNTDKVDDEEKVVVPLPELLIKKVNDKPVVDINEKIHYTVTVNQIIDKALATNVSVDDQMDKEGIEIDPNSFVLKVDGKKVDGAKFTLNEKKNGYHVDSYQNLRKENTMTIEYDARVTDVKLQGVAITNTATAHSPGVPDPEPSKSKTTPTVPNLDIVKTVDREIVSVGEIAHYTVEITETVDNATAFKVETSDLFVDHNMDPMTGMKILGDTMKVVKDGKDITADCKITYTAERNGYEIATNNNLKKPEKMTLTFDVLFEDAALQGVTLPNVAKAKAINVKEVRDDAKVDVKIDPVPELAIDKKVDKDSFEVGDKAPYTLTITNPEETTTARHIRIADENDKVIAPFIEDSFKVVFVGAGGKETDITKTSEFAFTKTERELEDGTVRAGNRFEIDTHMDLAYGEKFIVTYLLDLSDTELKSAEVNNTAEAWSDNARVYDDGNKKNEPVKVFDELEALKWSYVPSGVAVKNGEDIQYFIKVTNTSSETLTNVLVKDSVPELTTFKEAYNRGKLLNIDGVDTVCFTIPYLKAGQSAVVSFVVTVGEEAKAFDLIRNVALAKKTDDKVVTDDHFKTDDFGKTNETVHPLDPKVYDDEKITLGHPITEIVKKADKTLYKVGEYIHYEITAKVTNDPYVAANVVITDKDLTKGVEIDYTTVKVDGKAVEWVSEAEFKTEGATTHDAFSFYGLKTEAGFKIYMTNLNAKGVKVTFDALVKDKSLEGKQIDNTAVIETPDDPTAPHEAEVMVKVPMTYPSKITASPNTREPVKTGDETALGALIALVLASLMIIGAAFLERRKRMN